MFLCLPKGSPMSNSIQNKGGGSVPDKAFEGKCRSYNPIKQSYYFNRSVLSVRFSFKIIYKSILFYINDRFFVV